SEQGSGRAGGHPRPLTLSTTAGCLPSRLAHSGCPPPSVTNERGKRKILE
ncbi:unnamed protein product, partial [Gulo gulo]